MERSVGRSVGWISFFFLVFFLNSYLNDLTPTARALLLDHGVDEPLLGDALLDALGGTDRRVLLAIAGYGDGRTARRTGPGSQIAHQLDARFGRRRHHRILLRHVGVLMKELASLKASGKLLNERNKTK